MRKKKEGKGTFVLAEGQSIARTIFAMECSSMFTNPIQFKLFCSKDK